jgi:hypothetical protein
VSAEGKGITITAIEFDGKSIEQRALSSILIVPDNWPEGKEHVYLLSLTIFDLDSPTLSDPKEMRTLPMEVQNGQRFRDC